MGGVLVPKNKQTKLRRAAIFREAGFRTIRSGQPFAFAERLRPSATIDGRTPSADRRRLRGTTMSASSSTPCGMSTSTDA
jgi:hypothetical protein